MTNRTKIQIRGIFNRIWNLELPIDYLADTFDRFSKTMIKFNEVKEQLDVDNPEQKNVS